MPCWRHSSATGTPASPSLSTATIWLSVNLLFFKGISIQGRLRNSTGQRLLEWGAYEGIAASRSIGLFKNDEALRLTSLLRDLLLARLSDPGGVLASPTTLPPKWSAWSSKPQTLKRLITNFPP